MLSVVMIGLTAVISEFVLEWVLVLHTGEDLGEGTLLAFHYGWENETNVTKHLKSYFFVHT